MTKKWFRLSDSKPDATRDVDDELAFHLEMRMKEFMEQGMGREEARRRAEASFGDVQGIKRDLRDERSARNEERQRSDWWFGVRMDARYSLRALRKNPSFAAAAVATIALGIGATLAVYTVVNGVLVRPLPYAQPARLAMIWISAPNKDGTSNHLPLSSGFFAELQGQQRSFDEIAAFRAWPFALDAADGSEAEPVAGSMVSPALFDVLGVRPMLGKAFERAASQPGGPDEMLISYSLWQRRFASDNGIVGKRVRLSGRPVTVIGVMPPGFTFPRGAELPAPFQFGLRTDVWRPLVFDATALRNFGTMNLVAVGRRSSSVTSAQAQNEVSRIMKEFLAQNAPRVKLDYRLVPMADQSSLKVRRGLLILMGSVVFLLLIAVANVASLLVARAAGRHRELAVRAALGAGHGRIARQLVTENLVLAGAGGAIGVALSYWGSKLILSMVPGSMPRADDIGLDWRVLSVAGAVALVAGIVFGIAAAYSVSWARLAAALHDGGQRATGSRNVGRQSLVALEVALSLMLLIGASLLTRSFVHLQRVPPGFDATSVLTINGVLPIAGGFNPTENGPRWRESFTRATTALSAMPGVVTAGAISSLPLTGAFESGGLTIPGRPPMPPGQGPSAQYNVVSGDYFNAFRIRVVAGRVFDSSDDAATAASLVVSREFARRYFASDADAIDRVVVPTFTFGPPGREYRIIGVVDNVKQSSLDDEAAPQVYISVSQMAYPGLTFVIRTDGDPLTAIPAARRALREVDAAFSLKDIRAMDEVLSRSLARQRFSMTLIAIFAGAALALAIVGLYGVVALLAGQRRREIGVRLALGAQPSDVMRLVLGQGARLTLVGVALGLGGAWALTRVMRALLFEVSTTDAATFGAAALVVLLVSIAAILVPARTASRVDPTVTLRAD